VTQYDDLYKALADEHRREIVTALCEQPVVAGELAKRVGLAPNALSFHLKWLRSAGLIDMKRSGRHLWYHLNGSTLAAWREHVNAAFHPLPRHQIEPLVQHLALVRDATQAPVRISTPAMSSDDDISLPSELL
jgi:DNA-binding transcriptional ArsR family regulator